jgi:chromate transporter
VHRPLSLLKPTVTPIQKILERPTAGLASQGMAPKPVPRIGDLVVYFLRLGTFGFGGPVALCGLMEKELVQDRGWLTRQEMRDAIAISQSLPRPLAIQVGIFASYLRGGFWGAWAAGWAFILPNFLIVAVLGALYVHFGGLSWMTAIFYGVSPAVIALILNSCWRLAKLGMEDWLQWVIAVLCFVITIVFQAELAILFIGAGIIGILYYAVLLGRRKAPPASGAVALLPLGAVTAKPATTSTLGQLFIFSLKPVVSPSAAAWSLCLFWKRGWYNKRVGSTDASFSSRLQSVCSVPVRW